MTVVISALHDYSSGKVWLGFPLPLSGEIGMAFVPDLWAWIDDQGFSDASRGLVTERFDAL